MLIRCCKCGELLCDNPETVEQTELAEPVFVDYEAYCPDCFEDARQIAFNKVEKVLKSLTPLECAGLAVHGGVDWGDLYHEYIEEYES